MRNAVKMFCILCEEIVSPRALLKGWAVFQVACGLLAYMQGQMLQIVLVHQDFLSVNRWV